MKIKRIILMVALIISVASAQAQKSQVIAHRGYWKTAGSAQNSITALQKPILSIAMAPNLMYGLPKTINWLSIMTLSIR